MELNGRQKSILAYISENNTAQNRQIQEFLEKSGQEPVSRITVIRDLEVLLEAGLIRKEGAGRGVHYALAVSHPLFRYFDVEKYFSFGPDERTLHFQDFRFQIFAELHGLLNADEARQCDSLNTIYREKKEASSSTLRRKELERVTIELSWKSSQIEGNTYSLIDTEVLLKERKEAPGHKKEEAIMILNHKSAFDFLLSQPERFKTLSLNDIEAIHSLLISDLGVAKGMRSKMVGITGTRYRPLDNQHQIREAMEKMVAAINAETVPIAKALIASLLIAYIQPFEDGNKRTSRLLANALLLAHDYCPLSFRGIDEAEYKKAVILFYEQNSAQYFKELFLEQFDFAVQHAFEG